MPDPGRTETTIESVENTAIVSLRLGKTAVDAAAERLSLALPLRTDGGDPQSIWIGPDQWLLVSRSQSACSLIDTCRDALTDQLFIAADQSAALVPLRIAGDGARHLLASGCGIDVRTSRLKPGECRRTRLAQVPAVIVVSGDDQFDVYVERGYAEYLRRWFGVTVRGSWSNSP